MKNTTAIHVSQACEGLDACPAVDVPELGRPVPRRSTQKCHLKAATWPATVSMHAPFSMLHVRNGMVNKTGYPCKKRATKIRITTAIHVRNAKQ